MDNRIIISIATSVILALLAFPYIQIIDIKDRLISLEKDKEYLTVLFNERLKGCNDD